MAQAEFDFLLPPDRIAQHPARPRDAARLLHVAAGGLHDGAVCDLPALLRPGDIVVANDTRVIPAQLEGKRGNAHVGITLDRPLPDGSWHALARNARRLRPGDTIAFAGGLNAVLHRRDPDGGVVLTFDRDGDAFAAALSTAGALALPPYIARPTGPEPADAQDYQTVFAAHEGAVAAPTAGLHFSAGLLDALDQAGILRTTITLHVGAGTFLPLRDENLETLRLHSERGHIAAEAATTINQARAAGGRLVVIGTTCLRLLETSTDEAGQVQPFAGDTDIFIRPGHRFHSADLLVTNFHLPRSSLFMLVCAFAGTERMRAAYAHAIAAKYRFYSYGDATLLERA